MVLISVWLDAVSNVRLLWSSGGDLLWSLQEAHRQRRRVWIPRIPAVNADVKINVFTVCVGRRPASCPAASHWDTKEPLGRCAAVWTFTEHTWFKNMNVIKPQQRSSWFYWVQSLLEAPLASRMLCFHDNTTRWHDEGRGGCAPSHQGAASGRTSLQPVKTLKSFSLAEGVD